MAFKKSLASPVHQTGLHLSGRVLAIWDEKAPQDNGSPEGLWERSKSVKVCMVAYTFYEADNRVRRYAEALTSRGDEVDAVVLRHEGQAPFEIIRGVHVYRVQVRVVDETSPLTYLVKLLIFFLRSAWILLVRTIRDPYDIIHVHSVPDFEVFASMVPRLRGSRIILDIHDIVPEFYASKFKVGERSITYRILLLIEKLSSAYSSHVIISNHLWYSKLVRRSVKPEKCTAIINFPDTSIFYRRPRAVSSTGQFVLCYPGTLNQHQGVDVAIRAVALVREKMPNIKFLIFGDGPDREKLKAIIKQQRLEDCVTISGFVTIEEIAKTMADVDIGVVPKRSDSFGNEAFSTKIMEFMAMGVPVVASNTRIDRYYFNDQLVQFFNSEDVDDLASKILELAHDSAKCDALRSNAARFIEQNNWDVNKGEYLDLVDRLVRTKQPSSRLRKHRSKIALS